jgi:hypothetical protein
MVVNSWGEKQAEAHVAEAFRAEVLRLAQAPAGTCHRASHPGLDVEVPVGGDLGVNRGEVGGAVDLADEAAELGRLVLRLDVISRHVPSLHSSPGRLKRIWEQATGSAAAKALLGGAAGRRGCPNWACAGPRGQGSATGDCAPLRLTRCSGASALPTPAESGRS